MTAGLAIGIVALVVVTAVLLFIILAAVYAGRYKKVPPDQAMVVYGHPGKKGAFDIVTGGGRFIQPVVEAYAFMPLDVRTLKIKYSDVIFESKGKPKRVDLDTKLVFKISSQDKRMRVAAECLLHKTDAEINEVATVIIENNMRAVCRKTGKKMLRSDPEAVAEKIRKASDKELAGVGMEIKTFAIKEVLA